MSYKSERYRGFEILFYSGYDDKLVRAIVPYSSQEYLNPYDGKPRFYALGKTKKESFRNIKKEIDSFFVNLHSSQYEISDYDEENQEYVLSDGKGDTQYLSREEFFKKIGY